MEAPSAASVTSVTLANSTTGETVTWTGALSSGHWLKFDTARGVIEKSTDSGGNWTNVNYGVSGSYQDVRLKGGVQNTLVVTGVSSGTLTVTYTGRYL